MPFQSSLAVRRLNLVNRGCSRNAENLIKITLVRLRHSFSSFFASIIDVENCCVALVRKCFRCGGGTYSYTHHRRAQHASMENVAGLKNLQHGTVFVLGRLSAVHSLMQMWIKRLPRRVYAFNAELRNVVEQLLIYKLGATPVIFIFGFAVRRESLFESIDDGNQGLDQARGGAFGVFGPLLFDALFIVIEVRLAPPQRLAQVFQIRG